MNTLRSITRNSITYRADDGLLNTGDASYQHDADGFLLTKTVGNDETGYVYSSRGELLKVTFHQQDQQNQKIIGYVHDPLGRRIAKTVDNVVVEKYLWQGMTRLLAVYNVNNALIMRFEYADARMPFAMTTDSGTYFLAYDQVGSLRVVADGSGNPVKRTDYDSFGNVFYDSDPNFPVPFGFAGGLYDKDTKLVRFGYRDYDPDTGRWTAKDPIGFAGGDTDLYGYCVGDPVNLADRNGLAWITVNVDVSRRGPNSFTGSSKTTEGHAWVTIHNDDLSTQTIGNYPGGPDTERDRMRLPTISYTWEVTQEQADAAAEAAMRGQRYNFAADNCVDRVEAALDAAGIYHPDFGFLGISDPAILNKWLNDLRRFRR